MNKPAITLVSLLAASPALAMELSSANVVPGAPLATAQVKSGCGGENRSPALAWSGAPQATQSFAITVFDPDAHGGWWHWIALDIPASVHGLAEGAGSGEGMPRGAVQLSNDFNDPQYDGPCPPEGSGAHHYEITLWALPDAQAPLAANASTARVENYLESHALAHAQLVGTFER